MFTKTMTFENLDGKEVTQTFYFNYTMIEIGRLIEFDQLEEKMAKLTTPTSESGLTQIENNRQAYDIFEELIAGAYGVKSADGLEFEKTPELTRRFKNHVAFPELIFELLADDGAKAAEFLEGCLPAGKVAEAKRQLTLQNGGKEPTSKEEIQALVAEADRRQQNPETRVEPAVAPTEVITDGKTDDEILDMKPAQMTPAQLQRAMLLTSKKES